jgi:DNA-binding transcriptional LysR family regulator
VRELAILPWRNEEMMFACAPSHPLAQARSVKPEQLEGLSYVAFTRDLMIRRRSDQFLREHGVMVTVVSEFDTIENIKHAIEVGQGISLLPAPTFLQEVRSGSLVARPLEGSRFIRPIGIIHRRQPRLSNAALHFVKLLQDSGNAATPAATEPAANGQATETDGVAPSSASRAARIASKRNW